MKSYSRLSLRRVEAALRLRVARQSEALVPFAPVENVPIELPPETIELATGPFAARFPDLYARRKRVRR